MLRLRFTYEAYLTALKNLGLNVTILDADTNYPDGHFVEDPIIIFHDMAFVCKSGATARQVKQMAYCHN